MVLLPLVVATTAQARFFVPAAQPAQPAPGPALQQPAQVGFLQPYAEPYVEYMAPPLTAQTPVAADSSRGVFGAMLYMGAGAGVALLGIMGFTKAKSALAARSAEPVMSTKSIPSKQAWVTFVNAADCPPGTVASGFQYGQEIAIANDAGKYYAVANKLPPTSQPATFGEILGGGKLKEPITGTTFDMRTGKVIGEWCPSLIGKAFRLLVGPTTVNTYPVRKSGNSLQVQININAKLQFEQSYWRGVLDAQGKVDGGYY